MELPREPSVEEIGECRACPRLVRWRERVAADKVAGLLEQMAGEVFQAIPYTPLFNATGQPAMSMPLHWNEAGLPVGVHCVARFGADAMLFRLAAQLEQARPWFHRRPPGY